MAYLSYGLDYHFTVLVKFMKISFNNINTKLYNFTLTVTFFQFDIIFIEVDRNVIKMFNIHLFQKHGRNSLRLYQVSYNIVRQFIRHLQHNTLYIIVKEI